MSKTLNKEQQELVEKNHNLIYQFAKNKGLALDDYYDILAIGLCKAALTYDKDKGKFSTIAYCCMGNALKEHYRQMNKQCVIPENKILSYDVQLSDEDMNGSYIDTIADDCCVQDMIINNVTIQSAIDKLTNREKNIVKLLINGMKQHEIASILGCSRQNIGNCVQQIRKKCDAYLNR